MAKMKRYVKEARHSKSFAPVDRMNRAGNRGGWLIYVRAEVTTLQLSCGPQNQRAAATRRPKNRSVQRTPLRQLYEQPQGKTGWPWVISV